MMKNKKLMTTVVAGLTGLSLSAASNAAITAQYTFDTADIVGTAAQADKIGSSNSSEPGSAVTTGLAGQFGEAYSFGGGENNLMTIPSGVVPSGTDERTISIWFNQTADTTRQDKIFGYGAGTANNAFDISLENGGIYLRQFGGATFYGEGSFDFDGTDSGWNHLAVRVNSGATTFGDVDVFINGIQLAVTGEGGDSTTDPINTTASVFGIGTTPITDSNAFVQGFTGLLDELQIYDNALTNAEISGLATIPEPSSTALIGLGGLALILRRRSR